MIQFENVPVHKWHKKADFFSRPFIRQTRVWRRVMKHVGIALKEGKSVDMDHKIINPAYTYTGAAYDVISVTIK